MSDDEQKAEPKPIDVAKALRSVGADDVADEIERIRQRGKRR